MIHHHRFIWLLAVVLFVLPGCGQQTTQVVVSNETPAEPAILEVSPQNITALQPEQVEKEAEAQTSSEQPNEKQKDPAELAKESVQVMENSEKATDKQRTAADQNKPAEQAVAAQSPNKQTDAVPPTAPPPPPKATKVNGAGQPIISFSDFFDSDDRSTPSDRFWDLKGTEVEIKGFMGEVISMEKHWFLLIPEPGAECPFDNEDGTLWNEIMIVFVNKDDKLRYTQGPLKVKGTLDVGIKVDQSGYRTMFRLQNASFESM